MSKDSITLHPKFGVNPSMGKCFWCGGDTGEIALLGYNKGKEAPRHSILSYNPCKTCQENRAKGITVIELVPHRGEQRPEIIPGAIPTGRWLVITEDAVRRVFKPESTIEDILKSRGVYTERAVFEVFLPDDKKAAQPDKSDGESTS